MLSCELQLEALATGPGVWRLNTSILRDKEYTEQLTNTIKQDLRHMQALSPQDAWDQLKEILMAELQQATRAKSKEKEDISVQLQRDREQEHQIRTRRRSACWRNNGTNLNGDSTNFRRPR
jgi:hypothetical protein